MDPLRNPDGSGDCRLRVGEPDGRGAARCGAGWVSPPPCAPAGPRAARFEKEGLNGLPAARLLAKLVDDMIGELFEYARPTRAWTSPISSAWRRPAAMAAASWRRSATSTCCSCTADEPSPAALRVVEFMLYFLWDLGLKVGHATRSVEDCLTEAQRGHDHPHLAARCPPDRRRRSAVQGFPPPASAPPATRPGRPSSSPPSRPSATRATAATANRRSWSSPTSRKAAAACATCKRCTGSPATVRHADHGRTATDGPGGVLTETEARHGAAVVGLPVDGALSSALRRRPRRGAPDLRPAAGRRRPHGLHAPRPPGRRRALHAPLLPDRPRGGAADALLEPACCAPP